MEWTLAARPPFSLAAVANSHGWLQLAPFVKTDGGGFGYVARLDSGRVVELLVGAAAGGVSVTVPEPLSPAERDAISCQVSWMLDLERDLTPFYALARQEPKLAQMEAQGQGRLLRCPTLFEDVIKTILTTNTAWGGTIRMAAALVEHYGNPLPADPTRRAFPTPQRLAQANGDELRATARLGYRSPYVAELARLVAAGQLDLEALKTADLPTPQLRKKLLAIKGVGNYAAAHLLMFLGRCDFVPVDSWAMKMVSYEWHQGQPVGPAEVEAAFARWGEWQGLAYWFWDWSGPPA